MKPIVEIKKVKGYVPVVDEKKYVLDEIVYRRDGENTWNTLLTEEVAMVTWNNDGEKSSLILENEKLRSSLECIAEVGSEIESGDATELGKDMHRIAIDAFKNVKSVSFLEEENKRLKEENENLKKELDHINLKLKFAAHYINENCAEDSWNFNEVVDWVKNEKEPT